MAKIDRKKVAKALKSITETVNAIGLVPEEVILLVSSFCTECGASLHWTDLPIPEPLQDELIEKLFLEEPSAATSLMRVGLEIRKNLIE